MGIFDSLAKAAVGVVVETPVSLAADFLTLGGAITDKEVPYTYDTLKRVVDNVKDSTRPSYKD